jgi:hypothetical protein
MRPCFSEIHSAPANRTFFKIWHGVYGNVSRFYSSNTNILQLLNAQYFEADKIITLAAAKIMLYNLDSQTEIFIADPGIPNEVYAKFETEQLPFFKSNILKLKR